MKFTKLGSNILAIFYLTIIVVLFMEPVCAFATPYVLNVSPSTVSVQEDNGSLNFTVTLNPPIGSSSDTVTVNWDLFPGATYPFYSASDISGSSTGTLIFDSSAPSSQIVSISITSDGVVEGDESIVFEISGETVSPSQLLPPLNNTVTITNARGDGSIINDDVPTLSIDSGTVKLEGTSGESIVNYYVRSNLEVADNTEVTFDYTISDTASALGNDLNNGTSNSSITFGRAVTVPVRIKGDTIVEGNESYTVTISNPAVAHSASGVSLGSTTANCSIQNDDIPMLSVNDSSEYEGAGGTVPTGFEVSTDLAVAADTTVEFYWEVIHGDTTDNDFAGYPPVGMMPLSFQGASAGSTVSIPLYIQSDTDEENDEHYTVQLKSGSIFNSSGLAGTPSSNTGNGVILNDDYTFTISKTNNPTMGILAGGGHNAPNDGSVEVFTVSRGGSLPFIMNTTDTCYHIEDFQVDGTSEGRSGNYTSPNDYISDAYHFSLVDAPHSINLDLAINSYTITTQTYGGNGTITDGSTSDCDTAPGSGPTITATADQDHTITWFRVDGVDVPAAAGQASYSYTTPTVEKDYLIEAAFSVRATLLHEPSEPLGTVEIYSYDLATQTSTLLTPDFALSVMVDYGTELYFISTAETHTVQGPDYVATVNPVVYDDRVHNHHLSRVTDNGTVGAALCGSAYNSTDYRSDPVCRYSIAAMTEDHDVEILFTGFIDVSVYGYGQIESSPDNPVIAAVGGAAIGQFEFDAGEERELIFNAAEGWLVQSLEYKVETENITFDPGMVQISGAARYLVPPSIDTDHALHVDFVVDSFSIEASSTFETILYHDSALTDLVRVDDTDTITAVNYNENKEYHVVINDSDYAMVGVAIDGTFIPITMIRDYAAGSVTNPNSNIYTFAITAPVNTGDNEILKVTFTNVKVSHYLEVRDYDNVVIADVPLDAQANPNPPSLMFVMDDSGSMDWELLIQGASEGVYASRYRYLWSYDVVPSENRAYGASNYTIQDGYPGRWITQWSGFNKMFYNPQATYEPWPEFTGTVEDILDTDNDSSTTEIYSQLPAGTTDDKKAHANIYRPRHQGWRNYSCDLALTMAVNRKTGTIPTDAEMQSMKNTCDNVQTFDMDGEFLFIGGAPQITKILDDNEAVLSAVNWTTYGPANWYASYYNSTYRLGRTSSASAVYTFNPPETTQYDVAASWAYTGHDARYTISQNGTDLSTVVWTQDGLSRFTDGGKVIGTAVSLDANSPVTVTVTTLGTALMIDAIIFEWTGVTDKITSVINAHYYTFDDVNLDNKRATDGTEDIWLVNLTDPVTYTKVIDPSKDIDKDNIKEFMLGNDPNLPATLITYAVPAASDAFVIERQNFADWFSYYRTRHLAATSAFALALEGMSNVEVGIQTINYEYSSTTGLPSSGISQSALPINVWGERDKTKYLYYLLYDMEQEAHGTPLRSSLRDVARYLDATDGNSGSVYDTMQQSGLTKSDYTCGTGSSDSDDYLSPYAIGKNSDGNCEEENGDRCKFSVAILLTDGYYNGTYSDDFGAVALDAGHATELGPLYDDSLAKMAYYYRFKADLMADAGGAQQNVITYGVAFGMNGQETYDKNLLCSVDDASQCPNWPTPNAGGLTTIDDLWHASVTGGGEYLNADNPMALVDALKKIVGGLEGIQGSSASLAVNGDELYERLGDGIRMYQASWAVNGWTGDLRSYDPEACTITNGVVDLSTCQKWSARDTLGTVPTASRIIASYDPWSKTGIPFKYSSMDAKQKQRLFPYYAPLIANPEENIVDFVRGDVTLDVAVAQELRPRTYALGDIVNSQGRFQKYEVNDSNGNSPGDANYESTYEGIIFVGSNDGMLHAFSAQDADMGKELFAYVPGFVYRNLRELADPAYEGKRHKMFVDSAPYTDTINDGSTEKTILIGGLGKGGKGYYALDITHANTAISSEADLAGRVLWEYPPAPEVIVENATVNFTSSNRIEFTTALTQAQQTLLAKYTHFEIIGANGIVNTVLTSNDGVYKMASVDTGGTYIDISTIDFEVISGLTVTLLGSISDQDMGYSFSKPTIVRSNDLTIGYGGWVVIFGNGYSSENGDSVLYILHPVSGDVIRKIYTTRDGVHGNNFSGMSTPKIIDVTNNLKADYVYAGDLFGNMWKFDLTSNDSAKWQVAFCDGSSSKDLSDCTRTDNGQVTTPGFMIPQPLFSTGGKQPITGAPDVTRHQSRKGYMVIFGTGRFLGWNDIVNTDTQSLYGIWDWAPDEHDEGYLGSRSNNNGAVELTHYPQKDNVGVALRSLLKQEILIEGTIGEDTNGDGTLDADEDINDNGVEDFFWYYRIPTAFLGDWQMVTNSSLPSSGGCPAENGPANMSVPTRHLGWVVDLPGKLKEGVGSPPAGAIYAEGPLVDANGDQIKEYYDLGERLVNDTIIRDGKAIMISFGLNGDKCGASAYSFLNERNVHNGGMLNRPNYDTNGDGVVDWNDVVDDPDDPEHKKLIATDQLFSGRMSTPAIFGNDDDPNNPAPPSEMKFIGGSVSGSGNGANVISGPNVQAVQESAPRLGIHYWQQVE